MLVLEILRRELFWVGKATESIKKGWREAAATASLSDFPVVEGYALQIEWVRLRGTFRVSAVTKLPTEAGAPAPLLGSWAPRTNHLLPQNRSFLTYKQEEQKSGLLHGLRLDPLLP